MLISALHILSAHRPFSRSMITAPLFWGVRGVWFVLWRLSLFIAWLFWWLFAGSRTGMVVVPSRTLRSCSFARMKAYICRSTYAPFRRYLGNVRRELMQWLSLVFHGTLLGSYLRDA
jgi:hypothetical protein